MTNGIKIGSLNIQGLNYFKLYLLLQQQDLDIICIQETWLSGETMTPHLEGYNLLEQRRQKGTRGGIATYIKK